MPALSKQETIKSPTKFYQIRTLVRMRSSLFDNGVVFSVWGPACLGRLKGLVESLFRGLVGFEPMSLGLLEVGLWVSGLMPEVCFLFFSLLLSWSFAAIGVCTRAQVSSSLLWPRLWVFKGFLRVLGWFSGRGQDGSAWKAWATRPAAHLHNFSDIQPYLILILKKIKN